jgi:hypothetical protein
MIHYDSYLDARNHFTEMLDAAERGRVPTVRRDARTMALVDLERLRSLLAAEAPSRARVAQEADGWSVLVPGVPAAADGGTFEEAVDEMIDALREYAEDWQQGPADPPNHANNWSLVQLVGLSDNEQLRDWLLESVR